MKTLSLIVTGLLIAVACPSQPALHRPLPSPGAPPSVAPPPAREPVNYLIRVEWKTPKAGPKFLEVLTTEGSFNLDTIQKTSMKINDAEIPATLKFSGTITTLNDHKGRLKLFLGRTVPYVTGTYHGSGPARSSSYSQLSVGLDSTIIVTFGKSEVVQNDENGRISVLVKRMKD